MQYFKINLIICRDLYENSQVVIVHHNNESSFWEGERIDYDDRLPDEFSINSLFEKINGEWYEYCNNKIVGKYEKY